MEYGLIPKIDQAAQNNQLAIQQVQPLNKIAKVKEGFEPKEVSKIELQDSKEVNQTSNVKSSQQTAYQEVVLTNLNFGFNDKSNDFFVKAVRGEAENQYPTDDMMRLKAYLQAQEKEAVS